MVADYKMNKIIIPVIASILIFGTLGLSYDAFAGKDDNNGNNGCENANPNAKACEKNPNTTPDPVTCEDCLDTYWDAIDACGEDYDCRSVAYGVVTECFEKFHDGKM